MSDLIDRQAAIDRIRETGYADQIKENIIMILMCLPSAQPYTDDEIQKMQDLEQAQIQKAFALGREDAQKGEAMVSDNQITVWQDGNVNEGYVMKIQSRYLDDPMFNLEQERAIHAIMRSFLMVNRQTARRKRYAEKKKTGRR